MKLSIPLLVVIPLALSPVFSNPISADNIEQLNQQRSDYNLHQESLQDSSYFLDSTTSIKAQDSTKNHKEKNNKDITNTQEAKQHNKNTKQPKKDNKDSILQYPTMQTALQNPNDSTTNQKASNSQSSTQNTQSTSQDFLAPQYRQSMTHKQTPKHSYDSTNYEANHSQDATQSTQKSSPCFLIDYIALSLPPPSDSTLRQRVSKEFAFLRPILTSYQHKCLNTTDIATLLNSLKAKTIKKGYITTSFALSPQNLNTKTLLITMQTTTIGDIFIDKPKYVRLLRKDYPIKIGDFVNITKIERGLHNYKRLRSISPIIALQPYLADVSLDSSPPNTRESTLESNLASTPLTNTHKISKTTTYTPNPNNPQYVSNPYTLPFQPLQAPKQLLTQLQHHTTKSTKKPPTKVPKTKIYLTHHIKTLAKEGKLSKIHTPFYASLSVDNAGSNATNIYQTSLQLGLENLAGLAERLSLYVVSSPFFSKQDRQKYSLYTSLDFSMPFRRVLFSIFGSYSLYSQPLDIAKNTFMYNGYSSNMDVKAQILLYMDTHNHLKIHIGLGKRWAKNYLENIELTSQRRNLSNIYASLHYTRYVKNASIDISVGVKQGIKAFGAMDNFTPPTNTTNPANTTHSINPATPNFFYTLPTLDVFAYVPFRLKHQQFLHTSFIKTQISRTQLYASEKFSLGGIYSVRGFDSLVLNGEVGVLCRNDFSYYIKPIKTLLFIPSIALDIGYSTNLYDKLDDSLKGDNTLMGGGVGLKLHISKYINAEVWGYMPLYNPKNLPKRHLYFSVGSVF